MTDKPFDLTPNAVRLRYGMRVRVWIRAVTQKSDLEKKQRKKISVDGKVRFVGRIAVSEGIWGE